MGGRFEEMAEILEKTSPDLGVCLDTAHLFAAGYEINSPEGFEKMMKNISATFSASRVGLIHGNDSKAEMGSRKDRHEHLGFGKIGAKGFEILLSLAEFKDIDIIAETPPAKSALDVATLKRIRKRMKSRCL